jgi:hypothetical protein
MQSSCLWGGGDLPLRSVLEYKFCLMTLVTAIIEELLVPSTVFAASSINTWIFLWLS